MYGLLLENLAEYVKGKYGEDKWDDIRRQTGIDAPSFSVHQVYPENLLNKLAKKAQQVCVCQIFRHRIYRIWDTTFDLCTITFGRMSVRLMQLKCLASTRGLSHLLVNLHKMLIRFCIFISLSLLFSCSLHTFSSSKCARFSALGTCVRPNKRIWILKRRHRCWVFPRKNSWIKWAFVSWALSVNMDMIVCCRCWVDTCVTS